MYIICFKNLRITSLVFSTHGTKEKTIITSETKKDEFKLTLLKVTIRSTSIPYGLVLLPISKCQYDFKKNSCDASFLRAMPKSLKGFREWTVMHYHVKDYLLLAFERR